MHFSLFLPLCSNDPLTLNCLEGLRNRALIAEEAAAAERRAEKAEPLVKFGPRRSLRRVNGWKWFQTLSLPPQRGQLLRGDPLWGGSPFNPVPFCYSDFLQESYAGTFLFALSSPTRHFSDCRFGIPDSGREPRRLPRSRPPFPPHGTSSQPKQQMNFLRHFWKTAGENIIGWDEQLRTKILPHK